MERGAWPNGVESRNNQRAMVTGRRGVLGVFIVERLQTCGVAEITVSRSGEYKRFLR